MPPRTSVAICDREPLQQQIIEHGRPEAAPGHFGPRAPVGTTGQHGKRLPSGRDSPGIGGWDRHRSSQSERGPPNTAGAGRNGDNGSREGSWFVPGGGGYWCRAGGDGRGEDAM